MTKKVKSKKAMDNKTRSKAVQQGKAAFSAATKVLLAFCVGEMWLLLIRRFFAYGQLEQFLAWADILKYTGIAGVVLLVLGVILALVWRTSPKKRETGIWIAAAGLFLAVTGWVCYTFIPTGTIALCIIVPAMALLGLVYFLYQREFFWSVTILALGALDLWACRRGLGHGTTGTLVLVGTICLMVLLAAALLVFRQAEKSGGMMGKLRILPGDAAYPVLYASCAVSVAAMAAALIRVSLAYYLIWALAIAAFALTVYYTVKQL